MANPFYNHTDGVPANQSRGVSATVRNEFDLIAAGFDLVAPIASPAFTGVPTAPTAASGTNNTQVATTAFVIAQGLTSALPGQAGNAGKYITTNGTLASWADLVGITQLTSDNSTKVATTAYVVARVAQDAPAKDGTGATGTWNITAGKATYIDGGAAGQIPYQTGAGVTGFVPVGTATQILTSGGAAVPVWISTVPVANGGTGIATTTAYSPVFSGTTATGVFQASLGPGAAGQSLVSAGASALPAWGTAVLPGFIFGLTLSNNVSDATNDIDIATGKATDSTAAYLMSLTGPFTKRLDAAWAVGTGNGGLDTGAIANAEYNIWLIRKDLDGSIDALFSLSPTAPTMPAGYTTKRRLGSIYRSGGVIRPMFQKGDRFYFKTPPLDVDATLSTTATSYTVNVPAGSVGIFNTYASRAGVQAGVYVYSPEITDQALSETASPLTNLLTAAAGVATTSIAGQIEVLTSSTSQIRAVAQSASTTFRVATVGYIDRRGKDA